MENEIKKAFPDLGINTIQGGIQAKFNTGLKLTFYFKRGKYHNNLTNDWAILNPNNSQSIIKTIRAYTTKKSKHAEKKAEKIEKFEDVGTQACIDHIERKLKTLEKFDDQAKPNIQGRLMLRLLISELPQYL